MKAGVWRGVQKNKKTKKQKKNTKNLITKFAALLRN